MPRIALSLERLRRRAGGLAKETEGRMEFGCTGAAVLCLLGAIAISAMGGKLFPAWTAWPWWAKAISIAAAAALLLAGAALDEAGRWPKYIPPAGGEQDGDGKDTT